MLRAPNGSDLPASAPSAEEPIAAVRLEPGHLHTRRHVESLENFSGLGINSPYVAFVPFPGAVPELTVDPGDAGDKAVGFDRAKNRSGFGIDLVDFSVSIVPDPQRAFGPRQPRVAAASRRRNRRDHTAGLRIDLLNAILGELI